MDFGRRAFMLRALFHRFVELRREPIDEALWSPSGWSTGVGGEPRPDAAQEHVASTERPPSARPSPVQKKAA